ncbi:hypothetical protein ACFL4H_00250 [Candidatus Neomarinimicrobiota bacterium]
MKDKSAFPVIGTLWNSRQEPYQECLDSGMTLLDYFAGQVLASDVLIQYTPEHAVNKCYEIAEAMLKEREKRNGS